MNENELIDALRAAMTVPEAGEAQTIAEISKSMGKSRGGERPIRDAMRELLDRNAAEVVPIYRKRLDGSVHRTHGYRLK